MSRAGGSPFLDALGLMPDAHPALKKDLAFFGELPQVAPLRISVGDHYEDDVVAPKQFGWRSVWKVKSLDPESQQLGSFARPAAWKYSAEQAVQPDAIIVSMRELPQVVERLERWWFSLAPFPTPGGGGEINVR